MPPLDYVSIIRSVYGDRRAMLAGTAALAAGYKLNNSMSPEFALMADINPGTSVTAQASSTYASHSAAQAGAARGVGEGQPHGLVAVVRGVVEDHTIAAEERSQRLVHVVEQRQALGEAREPRHGFERHLGLG